MADANAATEKPSLAARAGAAVKEGWNNFRVGDGHVMAMLRQGFKELTHMLLPAFPGGQHVVEEPGLFGNPTQGEVARGREEQPAARPRVAALNEEPVRWETVAPSPGDIANAKASGSIHDGAKQNPASPSEIAESQDRQQGQEPGQQQGQSQSQSRGRGRGM